MLLPINAARLLWRMLALRINGTPSSHTVDYDAAAESYDGHYSKHLGQSAQRLIDQLPLRRGARVVDLACGTGFFTHRIAQRIGAEGLVTAVDLSPGMLAKNREGAAGLGLENVAFVEGDALGHLDGLDDASVDGVVCGWGICYMPHDRLRRAIERVLRPGGFVALIENKSNTLKAVSDVFAQVLLAYPTALAKHVSVDLPKNHAALVKTFCRNGVEPRKAWDGHIHVPCGSGREAWDYMVKSGASAGYIDAIDKRLFSAVSQRFIECADARIRKRGSMELKHEYCVLLAVKRMLPADEALALERA